RIVEPRLVDVEDRDRDPETGARPTVRLLEIGPAGFFETLDRAGWIRQADFGELRDDVAPAALEHAEHVGRGRHLPGRQRVELGERAARLLRPADRARRIAGADDLRWLALTRIGFADHVVFERDDAIVVGRAAEKHRAGRHQRALAGLDRIHVARAAGFARDAVVARVD